MELTKEVFRNSEFTFFFGRRLSLLENYLPFSNHCLNYSPETKCAVQSKNGKTVGVIGICVDSHAEISRDRIIDYVLENAENADQLVEIAKRFAGKYAIIANFGVADEYFVFPDATSCLSVYYYIGGEICFSSLEYLIARSYGLERSKKSLTVIKKAQNRNNIIMPNDMTRYDQIKCLLPNHYLNTGTGKAVRFYPKAGDGREIPVSQAAERTIALARNIISEYSAVGELLCALTGGWDSRLVLALLYDSNKNVQCYTSMQHGFTEKSDDIWIPEKIARMLNLRYRLVDDLPPARETEEIAMDFFGELTGVKAAFTQKELFRDLITIPGYVVGSVGKCGVGGTMPRFLGTASFFRCKLHNFSGEARRELKKWRKAANRVKTPVTLYDLFTFEIKCGRWAAIVENAFSFVGKTSLNIFNCREIIETWICIPRKDRIHNELHKAIFRALNPALLELPCNPGSQKSGFALIPFVMWVGSYLNYYYRKFRSGSRVL